MLLLVWRVVLGRILVVGVVVNRIGILAQHLTGSPGPAGGSGLCRGAVGRSVLSVGRWRGAWVSAEFLVLGLVLVAHDWRAIGALGAQSIFHLLSSREHHSDSCLKRGTTNRERENGFCRTKCDTVPYN